MPQTRPHLRRLAPGGVGDVVGVTVFEAAAGGLYIPAEAGIRPGNYVQLPEQAVDNDGNIVVEKDEEASAKARAQRVASPEDVPVEPDSVE